jgi:hypothetical protein
VQFGRGNESARPSHDMQSRVRMMMFMNMRSGHYGEGERENR